MSKYQTTRKCPECSEDIVLEEFNCVFINKRYFHDKCFIEKEINKKRGAKSLSEVEVFVQENIAENKDFIQDVIDKNHLYHWLMEKYQLRIIPSFLYQKMSDIFNGSWKNMKTGIPPADLLDMFKRQWKNLELIHVNNLNQGKYIVGEDKLNYDISVIVNKSGSYYEWKSQRQWERETIINRQKTEPKIDYARLLGKKVKEENLIVEQDDGLYE